MAAVRGYLAAIAAGNVTFWATGLIRAVVSGTIEENASIAGFLIVALFTLIISLVTTILPFLVFLALSRVLAIRGWPYFVACGMVMGAVSTAMVIGARWTEWQLWVANASLWQHLLVSGASGGFAFWWVAVRRRNREPPLAAE